MRAAPQGRIVQCTPTRARSGAGRALARAGRARASACALARRLGCSLHGWPLSRLNVKAIRCAPSRGRAHTKVTAARGRAASRSLRPLPRHCRRAADRAQCRINSGRLAWALLPLTSRVSNVRRDRQRGAHACACETAHAHTSPSRIWHRLYHVSVKTHRHPQPLPGGARGRADKRNKDDEDAGRASPAKRAAASTSTFVVLTAIGSRARAAAPARQVQLAANVEPEP